MISNFFQLCIAISIGEHPGLNLSEWYIIPNDYYSVNT